MQRVGIGVLISGLALFGVGGKAPAASASGPLAIVQKYTDDFNAGNFKAAAGLCDTPASVIDDFPPHHWQGTSACADWGNAFVAASKKAGWTDAVVTLKKPLHVDVNGNYAYVVAPTIYTYKDHGKPVSEGGLWTLSLRNGASGWRITGWAWADK